MKEAALKAGRFHSSIDFRSFPDMGRSPLPLFPYFHFSGRDDFWLGHPLTEMCGNFQKHFGMNYLLVFILSFGDESFLVFLQTVFGLSFSFTAHQLLLKRTSGPLKIRPRISYFSKIFKYFWWFSGSSQIISGMSPSLRNITNNDFGLIPDLKIHKN